MAGSYSPSSSQEPPNPRSTVAAASSRRLPPPCWSDDETVALIDAYRHKWYSLRRGNLRAPHWEEVAAGVAAQCPSRNPPKTSIQCRHKMEKLRKRYRSEIQRLGKGRRKPSPWIHFKQMDSMEFGSSFNPNPSNQEDEEEEEEEDENRNKVVLLGPKGIKQSNIVNRRYQGPIIGNGNGINGSNRIGVRIRIPNVTAVAPPPLSDLGLRNCNGSLSNGNDDAMVAAIGRLGDGILKVERMKMETVKEVESMRIKMEMRKTEMMIEWQQKLLDLFSTTLMEEDEKKKSKKIKRMLTP